MFTSDVDRVVVHPFPTSSSVDSLSPPPPAFTTLTRALLSEALAQSPDDGTTLDLTHKGFTDVGEAGAEELAIIGREDFMQGESSVLRCAPSMSSIQGI
jgi:hypothetical protein